jgi:hypothetical protein
VVNKRQLLFKQRMLSEFLIPILIMAAGVSLTTIEMISRSRSRILHPSRVSDIDKKETILFN